MLVLDANILIRAVLESRVLSLLRKYIEQVEFLAPDTAFEEARQLPRCARPPSARILRRGVAIWGAALTSLAY